MKLTKLHGDASNRTYYRFQKEGKESVIVMKLPGGASSVSEEITNLHEKPKELPFLNIQKYLKSLNLPVPAVLQYDEKKGLIFLEDLGDETLEKKLSVCKENERIPWYQRAIDLLIELQLKTKIPDSACIAFGRSFDEKLLNWEFDHFLEYGIEARQNTKIQEDDHHEIRRWTQFITFGLTKLPQIFTHRDYQSRNLMIHDGKLWILDFQDALLGPLPYDLVALLRDSYVQLSQEEVLALIDYYCHLSQDRENITIERSLFDKMFDWMTVQRKLKDAGRFVYIDRIKKNPSFLKFVSPSLTYVRQALERQKELKPLWEVLKKYVPEFS